MKEDNSEALDKLKGLAFLLDTVETTKEGDLGEHEFEREGLSVLSSLCIEIVRELEKKEWLNKDYSGKSIEVSLALLNVPLIIISSNE